jgi:hypothetical protein
MRQLVRCRNINMGDLLQTQKLVQVQLSAPTELGQQYLLNQMESIAGRENLRNRAVVKSVNQVI